MKSLTPDSIEFIINILEFHAENLSGGHWNREESSWTDEFAEKEYHECRDVAIKLYSMLLQPIQVTRTITYDVQGYLDYCADLDRKPSQSDFLDWVEGLVYDDFRQPVDIDFLTFKELDNENQKPTTNP